MVNQSNVSLTEIKFISKHIFETIYICKGLFKELGDLKKFLLKFAYNLWVTDLIQVLRSL